MQAKEQFNQSKMRQEQLIGYREDYIHQLEAMGAGGAEASRIRNRIDFINHLDTALVQLNNHLSHLARIRTKSEQNFKLARISEESVGKLIERVRVQEDLKLQRLEQKESDEYAQKQWYSRSTDEKIE